MNLYSSGQSEFYGEVYYGGVTRKEDDELVQYEFTDAKTGPLLIYAKLDNQRKLEDLQLLVRYKIFYRGRKEEDTMEAKTEQLIKTLTQMKGTSGHEGHLRIHEK